MTENRENQCSECIVCGKIFTNCSFLDEVTCPKCSRKDEGPKIKKMKNHDFSDRSQKKQKPRRFMENL